MHLINLYQNMVCSHESDLIRALAARSDVRITWVVDEEVLPFRRKMGLSHRDRIKLVVTTDARCSTPWWRRYA